MGNISLVFPTDTTYILKKQITVFYGKGIPTTNEISLHPNKIGILNTYLKSFGLGI